MFIIYQRWDTYTSAQLFSNDEKMRESNAKLYSICRGSCGQAKCTYLTSWYHVKRKLPISMPLNFIAVLFARWIELGLRVPLHVNQKESKWSVCFILPPKVVSSIPHTDFGPLNNVVEESPWSLLDAVLVL